MSALVKPASEKEILEVFAAADDRELHDESGNDDFLPYDIEFQGRGLVLAVKGKKNYDNSGVFVTLQITESSRPQEVKVGKRYTVAFFKTHKSMPEFVIKKHAVQEREFAAMLAKGADPQAETPHAVDANGKYLFKAAAVLLRLHREVDSLDIPVMFHNKFQKTTRAGKKIHDLLWARDDA
jgi:hypothetical protein